ncbi:hypothetical protein CHISP_1504 [Chitinispirillum alkaliphilum]|nr:hypothetical protein CHISP_1504 [Chitinispirillum alkaliphilum]
MISELSSAYWSHISDSAGELVRQRKDLDDFLEQESDLIDYGLCPGLLDVEKTRTEISDYDLSQSRITIQTMSGWLKDLIAKINEGAKKGQLTRDIKLSEIQIRKVQGEIKVIQNSRREMLAKNLEMNEKFVNKQLEALENTDQLLYESIRSKKAISRGMFFTVEQKREHCKRENQLQKDLKKADSVIDSIRDKTISSELKKACSSLEGLLSKVVDLENATAKLSEDLKELEKKAQETSPIELENRVRREIEYIRDMTRLSAKRLHLESMPLLKDGDKFINNKNLSDCINRILEFDPHIFHNDRVNMFGKPSILLVPGIGNSLYDWKNNILIVPLKSPSGNHMASIACGIIEYRLDVDEEKKLLTSYNQIPELKGIRSVFQIRTKLIKDYIGWMTSEYKGYRILPKDIKNWFEHEIAPPKNEIYTPPELQQYAVPTADYKTLLQEIELKTKDIEKCETNALWTGSVLYHQQGKFEKSFELISALVQRHPDNLLALYNYAQTASKVMKKSEALDAFKKYCEKNPQSWWARVARDRIRQLSM